jgi:hypothetical protein
VLHKRRRQHYNQKMILKYKIIVIHSQGPLL